MSTSRSGELIRNRKVLGLFLIRVFSGPITTLYWVWLPLYLRSGRAMSFAMIGLLGWLPNLFGMTGNVVGGFLTDRLVRLTGSADRGRKLAFTGAFRLSALSMAMPFVASDYVALALMGLALFGNQWVAATYIGTVGDVVPHQLAGRVNGIAGFGDSSSVLIAQLAIGFLVDRYSFTPVFIGAGIFPLLALASVLGGVGEDREGALSLIREFAFAVRSPRPGPQSSGEDRWLPLPQVVPAQPEGCGCRICGREAPTAECRGG